MLLFWFIDDVNYVSTDRATAEFNCCCCSSDVV